MTDPSGLHQVYDGLDLQWHPRHGAWRGRRSFTGVLALCRLDVPGLKLEFDSLSPARLVSVDVVPPDGDIDDDELDVFDRMIVALVGRAPAQGEVWHTLPDQDLLLSLWRVAALLADQPLLSETAGREGSTTVPLHSVWAVELAAAVGDMRSLGIDIADLVDDWDDGWVDAAVEWLGRRLGDALRDWRADALHQRARIAFELLDRPLPETWPQTVDPPGIRGEGRSEVRCMIVDGGCMVEVDSEDPIELIYFVGDDIIGHQVLDAAAGPRLAATICDLVPTSIKATPISSVTKVREAATIRDTALVEDWIMAADVVGWVNVGCDLLTVGRAEAAAEAFRRGAMARDRREAVRLESLETMALGSKSRSLRFGDRLWPAWAEQRSSKEGEKARARRGPAWLSDKLGKQFAAAGPRQ